MIKPVAARLVSPRWAREVVSPASDTMTEPQRVDFMTSHPKSFLHVTRWMPIGNEVEKTPLDIAQLNRRCLDTLIKSGAYGEPKTGMWLYRIDNGVHQQSAVIADVELSDYDEGLIRPHERTRTDREDQLALHLRTVKAVGSPVGITHRPDIDLSGVIEAGQALTPVLHFQGLGGLLQTVWELTAELIESATATLAGQPLYVTDGHHRLAAALRHRDDIERLSPGSVGPQHRLLAAIYPPDQLQTVAFHRILETDDSADDVVAALSEVANVEPVRTDADALPITHGTFGLYHRGRWHRFTPKSPDPDPLDVRWLQEEVLDAAFGVKSARSDPRLTHMPATAGIHELIDRCDRTNAMAFLLFATPPEAIMDAADEQHELPPKSSFFTPKPRSGIFVVSRESKP